MRPHRTETSSRRNGTALFTEVEIVHDRGKIRLRFVDLSPYQLLLVHEPVMPEDGCLIVKTLMAPIDNRPHSGGGSHDALYSAISTSTGSRGPEEPASYRLTATRDPRKNFFLSVNYLTLLDRFLNDAA